jgi:hypothetical protein
MSWRTLNVVALIYKVVKSGETKVGGKIFQPKMENCKFIQIFVLMSII